MRIAVVADRFSSLVASIFRQQIAPAVKAEPERTIRFLKTSTPIVGPAIIPRSEHHHESRQTSGAYLRARMFESVSSDAPRMSRRDRRRLAKQFARNEYRRMMVDDTNAADETKRGDVSCE